MEKMLLSIPKSGFWHFGWKGRISHQHSVNGLQSGLFSSIGFCLWRKSQIRQLPQGLFL